jgi:hypothetical protein
MLQRTIGAVRGCLTRRGLGRVFGGVRRIGVVRTESYHDVRNRCIGLNPADLRRPYAAFHRLPYLLLHELGHHLAEVWMSAAERRRLAPLFGNYDAPYRRAPKPRAADADHVSRYSMVHPAEDFAETFAVCLWADWEPEAVAALVRGKSARCRRKMAAMRGLLRRKARALRDSPWPPGGARKPKPRGQGALSSGAAGRARSSNPPWRR